MINRERLLAGLHELIYVEEGMVTMFANFAKALLRETEGMENEKKQEIEKLLSSLHRDSSRHKEMVDEMIKHVEISDKDEY